MMIIIVHDPELRLVPKIHIYNQIEAFFNLSHVANLNMAQLVPNNTEVM
jgi:hypothetical protein